MRLRKECEHGRYEKHYLYESVHKQTGGTFVDRRKVGTCPGGEFLPEGALVIEKENGEWPKWAFEQLDYWIMNSGDFVELFDALASQVGESER